MSRRSIIIAGGEVKLSELEVIKEADILIAVDAGVIPVLQYGLVPHYAVGDFDTLDQKLLENIEKKGISLKKLPIHKEETDTHYAIRFALEYKPQEIIVFGALGGARLDHMLANVGLLEEFIESGTAISLYHKSTRIRLLKGPVTWNIVRDMFHYISLIPVSSRVDGVTTEGLSYPLQNETLYRGKTHGISNELIGDSGAVFIADGKCLAIESKDG